MGKNLLLMLRGPGWGRVKAGMASFRRPYRHGSCGFLEYGGHLASCGFNWKYEATGKVSLKTLWCVCHQISSSQQPYVVSLLIRIMVVAITSKPQKSAASRNRNLFLTHIIFQGRWILVGDPSCGQPGGLQAVVPPNSWAWEPSAARLQAGMEKLTCSLKAWRLCVLLPLPFHWWELVMWSC